MKTGFRIMTMLIFAVTLMCMFSGEACAEEKMVGVVGAIKVAADGKSATVAVKDNKSGKEVSVIVTDDVTLDKLKDKRIQSGDEVRVKYNVEGGKNKSTYFRKTAGC